MDMYILYMCISYWLSGNDPDNVAEREKEQALDSIQLGAARQHSGSIKSIIEGQQDWDLSGISLTQNQVQ